ncbi:PQQ-binding-like beta-propeller repeat protein [Haloarcula sp. S1CR25-12]|uniref:PQQ-binding-like beta-propeller repeat protein n=1 Tax=Haloarcula saliterrae TaxID=2950534 RepID=A0ABU2FAA6_9EURY|nr:PQQ-binding-like beta-propeller repeat protein [Haloarcula sp. S1CR25-12]MDS0258858.1 PQQ-binding-like beta-propeller repeat protein [Haloarcula sp. S1CR25-12]
MTRTRRELLRIGGAACSIGLAGCLGVLDGGNAGTPTAADAAGPDAWRMVGAGPTGTRSLSVSGPRGNATEDWTATVGDFTGSPVVADGRLFVVGGDSDERTGTLAAFDAENGDELWRTDLEQINPQTPAVTGGVVYIGDEETAYAFDAETGEELWTVDAGRLVEGDATVANGLLVLPDADGAGLTAIDTENESVRWSADPGGNMTAAAIAGGTVYVGAGDTLYAYAADSGEERWAERFLGQVTSAPAVADGTVYAGVEQEVLAMDPDTGETLLDTDGGRGNFRHIAVSDGTIYVGGDDGTYAFSSEDGSQQWSRSSNASNPPIPVVAEETVYVRELSGAVVALDQSNGGVRWTYDTERQTRQTPALAEGVVYVATNSGTIEALRES